LPAATSRGARSERGRGMGWVEALNEARDMNEGWVLGERSSYSSAKRSVGLRSNNVIAGRERSESRELLPFGIFLGA
jgi:hypothetical protein